MVMKWWRSCEDPARSFRTGLGSGYRRAVAREEDATAVVDRLSYGNTLCGQRARIAVSNLDAGQDS
jgi:hypothetical protein